MKSPRYLESLTANSVEAALRRWQGVFPAFSVLALLPEAESTAVPVLQDACNRADVSLAEAIFPALVLESGRVQKGASCCRIVQIDWRPALKVYRRRWPCSTEWRSTATISMPMPCISR